MFGAATHVRFPNTWNFCRLENCPIANWFSTNIVISFYSACRILAPDCTTTLPL